MNARKRRAHSLLLAALLAIAPGHAADRTAYAQPLAALSADQLQRFDQGDRLFATRFGSTTGRYSGLGPRYAAAACADCHVRDGRSRPPDVDGPAIGALQLRFGNGDRALLDRYGPTISDRAIAGLAAEATWRIRFGVEPKRLADGSVVLQRSPQIDATAWAFGAPAGAVAHSMRMAPAIIGLGLLEALDAHELLTAADPDDLDADGISGRLAQLDGGAVGRFGWKATQPTLLAQTAHAALHDMGLRNRLYPVGDCPPAQADCSARAGKGIELGDTDLALLADYLGWHAVPPARPQTAAVQRGAKTFQQIGCAACHRPITGVVASGYRDPARRGAVVAAYTDLLLHDMGPGLGDGIVEGAASAQEWRTAPLWGLGLLPVVNGHQRLLHDGRALGFAEAIMWHAGEAEGSALRFAALSQAEREALIAFLESL